MDMAKLEMDLATLEAWVKWCIFDAARINGTIVPYGEVTKEVTYRGETTKVKTIITEEDFLSFTHSKDNYCAFA